MGCGSGCEQTEGNGSALAVPKVILCLWGDRVCGSVASWGALLELLTGTGDLPGTASHSTKLYGCVTFPRRFADIQINDFV